MMSILDEPITVCEDVESFKLEEHRDKYRVVALGDSTTLCIRWEKPRRWPSLLEGFLGRESTVINSGIGGTSSSLGLYRWPRDVAPIQPHCVVISFPLNDSAIRHYECRSSYVVQCTPDRMESNLRTMVNMARASGASPVFWTPPPVPPWIEQFKGLAHMSVQMRLLSDYVQIIEQVAADLEVPTANYWRTFPSLVEEYPGPYFNPPDGYHSNHNSLPVIARGLAELIRPLMEEWRKAGAMATGAG